MNDVTGIAAMRKTGCGVLVVQGLKGAGHFRYKGEKRSSYFSQLRSPRFRRHWVILTIHWRRLEEGVWAEDLSQLRHRELRAVVQEVSWNID